MKHLLKIGYMNPTLATLVFLFAFQLGNKQILNQKAFSIGETIEISSKVLNENRTVNVYLPESYGKDSLAEYPVIYLLDGSADEDCL